MRSASNKPKGCWCCCNDGDPVLFVGDFEPSDSELCAANDVVSSSSVLRCFGLLTSCSVS